MVITTTPVPTATITPVPTFMGSPIQPDPALLRAVNVSLAALGKNFETRLFTRASNGEAVVWVRDSRYPDTLLCGAPLYYPGLGSLLVLTTSHLFSAVNRFQTFDSIRGCIPVSLSKGKDQVKKILEVYQGIYDAAGSGQRFSSGDGVKIYVNNFLTRNQDKPFSNELNLVFVALTGDDFKRTSIDLVCPGVSCNSFYRYSFTGAPVSDEKSSTRSVPLAYARYFEQNVGATELYLLGPDGQKLQQVAQASPAKTSPLTTQEILTTWFYQDIWEQLVFSGEFTVGLGVIFPTMATEIESTNPAFSFLNPFSGVSHQNDASINQYWVSMRDYLDGLTKQISPTITSTYIQMVRNNTKNSYLDFMVFEEK